MDDETSVLIKLPITYLVLDKNQGYHYYCNSRLLILMVGVRYVWSFTIAHVQTGLIRRSWMYCPLSGVPLH